MMFIYRPFYPAANQIGTVIIERRLLPAYLSFLINDALPMVLTPLIVLSHVI
jgi:hypothetical protein